MDYNAELITQNMNLNKIYILTSKFTASASEAVINCLRPYMKPENVILIGETTYGKPVSMQAFKDERFNFTLWPVTAYVLNSEGKADYEKGIIPTYELNERALITPLYPLGDINELLLKNTISLITTGNMPDVDQPEEANEITSHTIYNSISRRNIKGVLVP